MEDVIVLDDDDFLHLIANEPHRFESNQLNNQMSTLTSVKAEQPPSASVTSIIDLTDPFEDLNDLFMMNSSLPSATTSPKVPINPETIKAEFDFKNFNFNFDSHQIPEILIDDDSNEIEDEEDKEEDEAEEEEERVELIGEHLVPENNVFSCHICSKTFAKLYNFKRHMFLHEAKLNSTNKLKIDKCSFRVSECEKCGKQMADKSNFKRHLKNCQGKEKRRRSDTLIIRDTSQTKELSLLGDKEIKQFVCEKCSKSFTKKFNLQRHLRVHFLRQLESTSDSTSGEYFECEKCARKFNESKQLEAHMAKWHSLAIQCKYCPSVNSASSVYSEKLDFIKHLNSAHSHQVIFRFECSICLRKFRFLSHYAQHRRSHFKSLQANAESSRAIDFLKCDLCDKRFTKEFNLKRHIRALHASERKKQRQSLSFNQYPM